MSQLSQSQLYPNPFLQHPGTAWNNASWGRCPLSQGAKLHRLDRPKESTTVAVFGYLSDQVENAGIMNKGVWRTRKKLKEAVEHKIAMRKERHQQDNLALDKIAKNGW